MSISVATPSSIGTSTTRKQGRAPPIASINAPNDVKVGRRSRVGMPAEERGPHRIVVLGAGYGGLTCALRLGRRLGSAVRAGELEIVLVDRNPYHLLETRLHEAAVRGVEVTIPIAKLLQRRPVRFIRADVTGLDIERRSVRTESGPIPYDALVIALGSKSASYGIPGLREHAFELKTLDDARGLKAHLEARFAEATGEPDPERRRRLRRVVIGGAGLTGVELATELTERIRDLTGVPLGAPDGGEVVLLEAANRILLAHDHATARSAHRVLRRAGIRIVTDVRLLEVRKNAVALSSDEVLPVGTVVWTGGVRVPEIFQEAGFRTGEKGRVVVGETLQVEGAPNVYAIGDAALARDPNSGEPIPMAAQFALQQGRVVADNLVARRAGDRPIPYRPRILGEVISLGKHLATGWLALGWIGRLRLTGFLASLLKRAIAERHLALLWRESRRWARPG